MQVYMSTEKKAAAIAFLAQKVGGATEQDNCSGGERDRGQRGRKNGTWLLPKCPKLGRIFLIWIKIQLASAQVKNSLKVQCSYVLSTLQVPK